MKNSTRLTILLLALVIILAVFFIVFFLRLKSLMGYMNTEIDIKEQRINYLEKQVEILSNYK